MATLDLALATGIGNAPRTGGTFAGAPLDAFAASLYAAYGLRRLVTAWTGALVTVRRDSDNATLTLSPGSDGRLDTAALLAFTGSASGHVTRWFDQTGAGRDAIQSTASLQPRLVSAGVLNTISAVPALSFDAADDILEIQSALGFSRAVSGLTMAAIVEAATTPAADSVLFMSPVSGSTSRIGIGYAAGPLTSLFGRRLDADTYQRQTAPYVAGPHRFIGRARYSDAACDIVINGTVTAQTFQTAGSTSDTDSGTPPLIGSSYGGVYKFAGRVGAVVLSRAALNAAALDAALAGILT